MLREKTNKKTKKHIHVVCEMALIHYLRENEVGYVKEGLDSPDKSV